MRAVVYDAAREFTVRDVPTPEPRPGEVRVRVRTSGVNPSDVKSRSGSTRRPMPFPRIIPHSDGAGEIEEEDVVEAVGTEEIAEPVYVGDMPEPVRPPV